MKSRMWAHIGQRKALCNLKHMATKIAGDKKKVGQPTRRLSTALWPRWTTRRKMINVWSHGDIATYHLYIMSSIMSMTWYDIHNHTDIMPYHDMVSCSVQISCRIMTMYHVPYHAYIMFSIMQISCRIMTMYHVPYHAYIMYIWKNRPEENSNISRRITLCV